MGRVEARTSVLRHPTMLTKRIIPCLDVTGGRVVKGTRFLALRDAGDPVECAIAYDRQGADELVFLDITASSDERDTMVDVVERTAAHCFMPLTVGGGIRKVADVRTMLNAGADKVSVNTAAINEPRLIADAAGPSGMVGGQAIDLRAAADGAPALDADALRDMHGRKTGALIRAAALAGASMAGAGPALCTAIDEYASQVGLAFQIVDDILDVEGASAELGKTAGKDAAAGKPTYPSLYGLDGSRRLATECLHRALAALDGAGLSGHLPGLAGWVVGRHS